MDASQFVLPLLCGLMLDGATAAQTEPARIDDGPPVIVCYPAPAITAARTLSAALDCYGDVLIAVSLSDARLQLPAAELLARPDVWLGGDRADLLAALVQNPFPRVYLQTIAIQRLADAPWRVIVSQIQCIAPVQLSDDHQASDLPAIETDLTRTGCPQRYRFTARMTVPSGAHCLTVDRVVTGKVAQVFLRHTRPAPGEATITVIETLVVDLDLGTLPGERVEVYLWRATRGCEQAPDYQMVRVHPIFGG